jgi:hypothetical protein
MAHRLLNDPQHWLERAQEMRTLAKQSTDAEAMRVLLKIANDYESLATRAQQRISSATRPKTKSKQSPEPK